MRPHSWGDEFVWIHRNGKAAEDAFAIQYGKSLVSAINMIPANYIFANYASADNLRGRPKANKDALPLIAYIAIFDDLNISRSTIDMIEQMIISQRQATHSTRLCQLFFAPSNIETAVGQFAARP